MINTFHLTGFTPPLVKKEFSGFTLCFPETSPILVRETCQRLKERHRALTNKPVLEIVEAIGQVSARCLLPDDPFRKKAEEVLPSLTRFSKEMTRWALDSLFRSLQKDQLEALLNDAFVDPAVLDRFVPRKHGGFSRAIGPSLTIQILSGNIPGLAIQGIVFSLLTKSPTLLKPSTDEPILAALFCASLAEVDSELGSCIAVLPWKGGSTEIEAEAFREAELVIAYGDAETINDLADRVPKQLRFTPFGPRLSIGIIAKEFVNPQTAQKAALDVTRFDMRGCLSPQIFFVEETGAGLSEEFALSLAGELQKLTPFLPPGAPSLAEGGRMQQLRGTYAMKGGRLWSGAGFDVVLDPEGNLSPTSGGGRLVLVKPVNDLSTLPTSLSPLKGSLQGLGYALDLDRHGRLVEALTSLGLSRLCPIGKLQEPPLAWHQEGRARLADQVRWVDLEL